jgi:aminotransferase
MKKRLSEIEGVIPNTPRGHYWAWPNVSSFGMTSQELAEYLVKEANVFCRPGTWYGINAEGHFRINTSIPMDYIDEALDRMQDGLGKIQK